MDKTPDRFYVYVLMDGVVAAYVGKGSGSRRLVQERRFGLPSSVLQTFHSEDAAYKAERAWIAELKPTENRHPGGNGSRAVPVRAYRPDKTERLIASLGSRVYAARLLLACERSRPGVVDSSKLEAVRQVTYGCGA